MKESSPSVHEWKGLYDAAVRFGELESWDWLYDSDVFGVQNPANKEIGYCCIMGNLGQMFGLAVYLGAEGLEGYLKIQSGQISPERVNPIEALMLQKCLMASFEDRGVLQRTDLQVIRRLRLKFRGRHAWPFFRSHRPGYHPWYVTKDEARYLTLALQQATEVALRFKEDPELLTPPKGNCYFVRVPEKEGKRWKWQDAWLEPAPVAREEREEGDATPIVDEVRLQRIRNIMERQRGVWEGDFFYAPSPVQERGDRPYYPYVIFWIEGRSGMILKTDLVKPSEYILEFPERFLSLIEQVGSLPREVRVKKEEAFDLLEPVASRLKIKLGRVRRLKALENAQASMFEFFGTS